MAEYVVYPDGKILYSLPKARKYADKCAKAGEPSRVERTSDEKVVYRTGTKNPVRGRYQKSIQQDLLSGATVRPPAYTLKGKAKSYGKKYAQSFAAAIKDLEAQGVKVIRTPGVRGGEWGATYRKANGRGKGKGSGKKNPAGSTRVYKAKRVRITQYPDGSTRVHIER